MEVYAEFMPPFFVQPIVVEEEHGELLYHQTEKE